MTEPSTIVDLREAHDHSLLAEVYNKLYLTHFPIPEEQETLEQYTQRLFGPYAPAPQPEVHLAVIGHDLHYPDRRVLQGFALFELYRESRCGLLTYIAVPEEMRGKGIGKKLILFVKQTLTRRVRELSNEQAELRGMFAECHKPECVDRAAEPIDPDVRLKTMEAFGAALTPIDYVQPELQEGGERSSRLLFVTFSTDSFVPPTHFSARVLIDFWTEFYGSLGVEGIDTDEDYVRMQSQALAGGERDRFLRYPIRVVGITSSP